MISSEQLVIQQTKNWIEEVVIGLNLCPFASSVFEGNRIGYQVLTGSDTALHLQRLADSFTELDNTGTTETSLLIFPESYGKFDEYLDFLEISNQLLEELNYAGIYQLASFHPDYLFADSTEDDASNFSNRSPHPMLHMLRESSIQRAVSSYKNIEQVPENNIIKLREIGYERMQQIMSHILKVPS